MREVGIAGRGEPDIATEAAAVHIAPFARPDTMSYHGSVREGSDKTV